MLTVNNELIALIAEGATEEAILSVLIDHNGLIYNWDDLLQQEIIRCRSGKEFARKYLNKSIGKKVKIYRILDSKKERFKLPLAYKNKVSEIVNIYTRPEIEILHIIFHGDYRQYKNQSHVKPSIYAKENYKDLKNIKSFKENYNFWNENYDSLVHALKIYKKYSNNKELCIADLLSS